MDLKSVDNFPAGTSPFSARFRALLNEMAEICYRAGQMVGRNGVKVAHTGNAIEVVGSGGDGERSSGFKSFYARVTGVAALGSSDSRWIYNIAEITISITASGGTPSEFAINAPTNGKSGKALNLAELANGDITAIAFAIDRNGADYPDGFAPRPISGGGTTSDHEQAVIVHIIGSVSASDGTTIYLFDRMGTHDGTCEAEE